MCKFCGKAQFPHSFGQFARRYEEASSLSMSHTVEKSNQIKKYDRQNKYICIFDILITLQVLLKFSRRCTKNTYYLGEKKISTHLRQLSLRWLMFSWFIFEYLVTILTVIITFFFFLTLTYLSKIVVKTTGCFFLVNICSWTFLELLQYFLDIKLRDHLLVWSSQQLFPCDVPKIVLMPHLYSFLWLMRNSLKLNIFFVVKLTGHSISWLAAVILVTWHVNVQIFSYI